MSDRTPVVTSWTEEQLDVIDTLAFLENVRGSKRSAMLRAIVEERLAYVMAHDAQVREVVALIREHRAAIRGQQRFRLIEGGKP